MDYANNKTSEVALFYSQYSDKKLVNYHAWQQISHYSNLKNELKQLESSAGLVDLCHFGVIWVRGEEAAIELDDLLDTNINSLPEGSVVNLNINTDSKPAEVSIYKLSNINIMVKPFEEDILLVFEYLLKNKKYSNCLIEDHSKCYGCIGIVGNNSDHIIEALTVDHNIAAWPTFYGSDCQIEERICYIIKNKLRGYNCYEIFLNKKDTMNLWSIINDKVAPNREIGIGVRTIDFLVNCLSINLSSSDDGPLFL